jgi:hypothetical protein
VCTTIEKTRLLDSMANDFAPAMDTYGRQPMNCTLEAIERVRDTLHGHIERFIVVVPADFTTSHKINSLLFGVNQIDGLILLLG